MIDEIADTLANAGRIVLQLRSRIHHLEQLVHDLERENGEHLDTIHTLQQRNEPAA